MYDAQVVGGRWVSDFVRYLSPSVSLYAAPIRCTQHTQHFPSKLIKHGCTTSCAHPAPPHPTSPCVVQVQDTSYGHNTLTLDTLVQQGCGGLVTDCRTHPTVCRKMSSAQYRQLQRLRSFWLVPEFGPGLCSLPLRSSFTTLLTLPSLQHATLDLWGGWHSSDVEGGADVDGAGADAATGSDAEERGSLPHITLLGRAEPRDLVPLLETLPKLQLLEWWVGSP